VSVSKDVDSKRARVREWFLPEIHNSTGGLDALQASHTRTQMAALPGSPFVAFG